MANSIVHEFSEHLCSRKSLDPVLKYGVFRDLELVELRCLAKKIRSRAVFGGSEALRAYPKEALRVDAAPLQFLLVFYLPCKLDPQQDLELYIS